MDIRTSYAFEDLDFDIIAPETQASYWGKGRTREGIITSFENSFLVGLYLDDRRMIGWARATSDTVYLAYISDLQILPDFRGQGLGKRLTKDLMDHPDLKSVSGWMLSTDYHHDFYSKFGFADAEPRRYMSLSR
ncbi:MAG: GNAT family N-acetyltransferase [Hyphomicrobiaceae bacterium]|nr:GNAT family N-acetyltransferase [Hyphomicrobiaceae bacterium]